MSADGREGPASPAPARDPYRALFEQSADAILIIDGETFVDCNQATVDMLRYKSKEDLLRSHPSELSPPTQPDGRDSYAKANEMIATAFERGSYRFEWDHMRADGEVFPVEVLLTAVPFEDRRILHVVWRDITERKQLEQQLRQTQKMEALGKLAGGIAHDFNNLLVAILGNAELLAEETAAQPRLHDLVQEISRAAQRAADLTGQLLTFSRSQVVQRKLIDLNSVVLGLEKLLARLIGEDVRLVIEPCEGELTIRADAGQIEQVVLNLITNARDALPSGGVVTLRTREIHLERNTPGFPGGMRPGSYAELSVSDTGEGMTPEVAKRAFDPFYTTKEVGRGTGLGLSTVYGIVKHGDGEITLESAPGEGTTIRLWLPIVREDSRPALPVANAVPTPRGNRETVLVAEDEPSVAALVERVLTQSGYRVLLASNGREALELLSRREVPVDLLLTDMVMPQMGGLELVARVKEMGVSTRVLFTSGYMDRAHTQAPVLEEGALLLRKPFTPVELLRRIREALDRP